MTSPFYLTPASLGYLTQFVLSFMIGGYLLWRLRIAANRTTPSILLACFFVLVTVFIGLFFLDMSLLPTPRLYAVYLENAALGGAIVLLLQFAYRFPAHYANRKVESYAVLVVSLAYTLYELGFALYRYWLLITQDMVVYREPWIDYALVILLFWVPVAFLRQAVRSDKRPIHWAKKLFHLQGSDSIAVRNFALIYLILPCLGLVNIFRGGSYISTTVYNIVLSAGILTVLLLFIISFINSIPEMTSFMVKLSGITLTILLAVLGAVGWIVAPNLINTYQPEISEQQTLHFTPDGQGGYRVAEVPFHFETDLGEAMDVNFNNVHRSHQLDFSFSYFSHTYEQVYATSSGLIVLDDPLYHPNLQDHFGTSPAIIPLLIDLESSETGRVYANIHPDRLVVTWNNMSAFQQPDSRFTFQAVLYANGSLDFNYQGLPYPMVFDPNANPSSNPWARGLVSGSDQTEIRLTDLAQAGSITADGLVQDFQMDFRNRLNQIMTPIIWLVFAGSLIILIGLPYLFQTMLVHPLRVLLKGVQEIDKGNLDVNLKVQHLDEIGLLTNSFNAMASQLKSLINDLDARVSERTSELTKVNSELRLKLSEIRKLHKQLRLQAVRDPLTGVFNRRYLGEMLTSAIATAERGGHSISFVVIDIDHFKTVNDLFGHHLGDTILQEFGRLLLAGTRKGDIACRLGGEEFILLMPYATIENSWKRVDEIRTNFELMTSSILPDPSIHITLSAGVAVYPEHGKDYDTLFKNADAALYVAKHKGRNRVEVFL
jgi:diguanylate cyclase (GGDEF)-like protein